MTWTSAQRRASRREYQRLYASPRSHKLPTSHVSVPENIVRIETHVPCGFCGVAHGCKHRKWLLEGGR
jgi:hypothetical protein